MQISIDHAKLIVFLRSEIDRRHPHKKPPYYFSKYVREGNLTRTGLFDLLDDPVVTETLKECCAEINTDWNASGIAEILMSIILARVSDHEAGNVEFKAVMMDRCAQIASMINDYLRSQTK
jgi:hypothetical protein